MAGPTTESVNEDVKELREDLHKVAASITADVHKLAVGLAELRQEVRDAIGLAKWAATVAMGVLVTSGIGAVIWGASLTTKVYGMESRGNEKFQEAASRAEKLEASINARFDKLEASITRALDQLKPAGPK
jgi:hypothetical protein